MNCYCVFAFIITTFITFPESFSQQLLLRESNLKLTINITSTGLNLQLSHAGITKLSALIGVGLNTASVKNCFGIDNCLVFENNVRLHVTYGDKGFELLWKTNDTSRTFKDCYDLPKNVNWYGGPENYRQAWPIEKLTLRESDYVTKEADWQGIAEPYWLNSLGAYIFVDKKVPLFVDQNSKRNNTVCFISKIKKPYANRNKVLLKYYVMARDNSKDAHLLAVSRFLGKPKGYPNYKMIQRPIWSTWAKFKKDINDSVLLKYAGEIVRYGYKDGQFEIDDLWEDCYGSLTFSNSKFSQINQTVAKIKELGFRVTLWTHPFVDTNCELYSKIGVENNFFVKNLNGSAMTSWWNNRDTQHVDFTNPEANEWFFERIKLLQIKHGIDSFKFDAGESSWPPQIPVLEDDVDLAPNIITQKYVRSCASFGDLIEVRTGWRTQDLPVFVRMIDKESRWDIEDGLYTLITTLLQMNMNGYTLVLPDMVGGNGYQGRPDAELFVRWLQANTFMPAIQFSYVPWDYEDFKEFDVLNISKKYVALHDAYANEIVRVMKNNIDFGDPVNGPIWWIDPTNKDALNEDTEYLLGEDIVVAPIISKGTTYRNVVLPKGEWIDGNNGTVYEGNQTLMDYYAPIEVLPYFVRKGSIPSKLIQF